MIELHWLPVFMLTYGQGWCVSIINLRYLFRRKRVKRMGCGRHNLVLQGFRVQTFSEQQQRFCVLFIAQMDETEILI